MGTGQDEFVIKAKKVIIVTIKEEKNKQRMATRGWIKFEYEFVRSE